MSKKIATREAYGKALAALADVNKDIVVLDFERSASKTTISLFTSANAANAFP